MVLMRPDQNHHPFYYSSLLIFLFLHHLPFSTHSLTLPSDTAALKSFKSSIKPSSIPPYSCLGSWDFTADDPCTQPRRTHFICGLTCSPDNTRIVSITLDSPGYTGTLSPLLSKLTRLELLDINDNKFYGAIPASLSSLSYLRTLSFRRNSFSGPLPPSIGRLGSLEALDFSMNSLSGPIPNTLSSLKKLRRLDLSFNRFTGYIPKLPSNLLELAIKANSLSGPLTEASFDGLAQLEVVELSVNSMTGIVSSWFFQLPSLQQANLSNNSFAGVEIRKPSNPETNSLVAVDLGFNKITGYVPANFAYYPMLSSLTMRYNRLRGEIPWQFGRKGSLRRIFLDGNYLIGKPPAAFFVVGGGESEVVGSLGDNCLKGCPVSSEMCSPSQKPMSVCKQAYRGRRRLTA